VSVVFVISWVVVVVVVVFVLVFVVFIFVVDTIIIVFMNVIISPKLGLERHEYIQSEQT
jgi:hypothetical protein